MVGMWGFILLGLLGLLTLIMVASFGGTGVAYLLRIRRVQTARPTAIGNAAAADGGTLRLRGNAEGALGEAPTTLPGSDEPVVAWSGWLEELKEPEWRPVRPIRSARTLVLASNGDSIDVDPSGALWELSTTACPERTLAAADMDEETMAEVLGDNDAPRNPWRIRVQGVSAGTELLVVTAPPTSGGDGARVLLEPIVISDGDPTPAVVALRGRAVAAILLSAVLVAAVVAYMLSTLQGVAL